MRPGDRETTSVQSKPPKTGADGPQRSVFIIIPSYNEGAVLAQTVESLRPFGYSIVVVDDGSKIPAAQFLEGQHVHLLRHCVNLGQGAALQTGMDYALSQGAEYVVHFDADGQHDPHLIARLLEPLRKGACDVALGSRFLLKDDRQQVPLKKQLLLKGGVMVSWLSTRVWLTDTHNGLRALTRQAASQIRLTESGFAHATEILECIRRARLRYREVPTTIRYTEYSMAKGQSVWNSINIVFDLLARKVIR